MKKLLKSLLAIASAFLMVFSLGTAVNAVESTYTITINDANVSGSTYSAYKILDLSYSETTNSDGTTSGHYNYTIPTKYASVWSSLSVNSADDLTTYFNGIDSDTTGLSSDYTASEMGAKAKEIYNKIEASTTTLSADATGTISTENENQVVFSGLSSGYYLIVETGATAENEADTRAIVVNVTDESVTVNSKENYPTVTKKVQEKNDSSNLENSNSQTSDWQDAADYDIGDNVPYQLKGTLPEDYKLYETYHYEFVDTLSAGLGEPSITSVDLYNGATKLGTFVKDTDYTTSYVTTAVTDTDYSGGKDFHIYFRDLKTSSLASSITKDTTIVVNYTSELTKNANIGSKGNPNEVVLKYSSNPYSTGSGDHDDTGKTPKDKVIVFTYKTVITKVDEKGNNLTGATFKLEKINKDNSLTTITASTTTSDPVFTYSGLDAGTYKLTEVTAPEGYKKIDPITFTITATYDIESDDPALKNLTGTDSTGKLSFTRDTATDDALKSNLQNSTGNNLPTTGGIGTTMFYVVGGALVAVATVLLISKKRASAE